MESTNDNLPAYTRNFMRHETAVRQRLCNFLFASGPCTTQDKFGSGSILTSQNPLHHQDGKVNPGDWIHAVKADKSVFDMLKSAIKADSQHTQITKANQGPSEQTRTTKAHQPLDPEISIIDFNPLKKSRWDVSNPDTSGSDDRSTDHEDVLDTEASASDDITSAARWAAREELSSFLELVARKPLINFERKTMCREYPRPNVDAVYTPEVDDYIAALVQGAKAIHHRKKDGGCTV